MITSRTINLGIKTERHAAEDVLFSYMDLGKETAETLWQKNGNSILRIILFFQVVLSQLA